VYGFGYVDDATGKLMELRFVVSESAFDYFAATESYLGRHGKPVAFYSDKHSIFRVTQEGASGRSGGVTHFGRALADLNIDIICANTPQAKGRVERMNKTLQDSWSRRCGCEESAAWRRPTPVQIGWPRRWQPPRRVLGARPQ
jgi:hypothetical protein